MGQSQDQKAKKAEEKIKKKLKKRWDKFNDIQAKQSKEAMQK